MTFASSLLLTLVGISVYDASASLLSRRFGFNYAYASIGSLLLYATGDRLLWGSKAPSAGRLL